MDVTEHSPFPSTRNMTCITPWLKSDCSLQGHIPQRTSHGLLQTVSGFVHIQLYLCALPQLQGELALSQKDTLGITLQYGVIGVVWVLHCDGLGELAQHPLLEGFQPLIVVAPTHILFVLQEGQAQIRVLKSKLNSIDFYLTLNVTSKPKINDSGNMLMWE